MEMFSPQGVNDPTNPLYQSGEGIIDKILEQGSPFKRLSDVPKGLSFFFKTLSEDRQCLKLKPKKLLLNIKENMKKTKEMDTEEV